MKRRSFIKALTAAVGAVGLVPYIGKAGVEPPEPAGRAGGEPQGDVGHSAPPGIGPQPEPKPVPEGTVAEIFRKTDSVTTTLRVCANCGFHSARWNSAVCSPLCNWYRATPLIERLGRPRWEDWRERSVAFLLGAGLNYEQFVEFTSKDFESAKMPRRIDGPVAPDKRDNTASTRRGHGGDGGAASGSGGGEARG